MADAVIAKIRARLYEPHVIEGHEIRITASVGSALYPGDGTSYEQLMKHADMAMYVAKAASSLAVIDASPAPLLEPEPMKPEHHRHARGVASVPIALI